MTVQRGTPPTQPDSALVGGPQVDPDNGSVTFVVLPGTLSRRPERVWFHLREFGADPSFRTVGGLWQARIPAPPVDRLEYQLIERAPDGSEFMVLDPGNPHRAVGVFGDQSLLELPDYRPPIWLDQESTPWNGQLITVDTPLDGVVIVGELLTPPGSTWDEPLPMLVVHDGPEYSRLARLGDYLHWLAGPAPELRCRALLLQPDDRDRSYAACATYAQALVEQAIPGAKELAPTVGPVLGMGASLGALAMAHAAGTYPGTFGGLLLQSGSFFLPTFDAHEKRFRYFDEVVDAVTVLHANPSPLVGIDISITVGLGEENLDNNRALAARLRELGVVARLAEGRDGHNYTAWRDLWHPALGELIRGAVEG